MPSSTPMADARLPERLTLAEADATLASLVQAARGGRGAFTVDATALSAFDSSAVAVLLELARQLDADGRGLRVTGWPPRLRDLVALYGVESLLPAH